MRVDGNEYMEVNEVEKWEVERERRNIGKKIVEYVKYREGGK